jgi:TolB protein
VITPSQVGLAAFGPLYVVEMETNRTRELSDRPVLAFFWSPDGKKLAYLVADDRSDELRLRWYVWEGGRPRPYSSFLPSRTFFQGYIVFFDQYAQSMSIWSPDSTAFTYAGTDEAGRSGIWVQTLGADIAPVWVGRGVVASWSPR